MCELSCDHIDSTKYIIGVSSTNVRKIIGASLSEPHIDDTCVCEIYYYWGEPEHPTCSRLCQSWFIYVSMYRTYVHSIYTRVPINGNLPVQYHLMHAHVYMTVSIPVRTVYALYMYATRTHISFAKMESASNNFPMQESSTSELADRRNRQRCERDRAHCAAAQREEQLRKRRLGNRAKRVQESEQQREVRLLRWQVSQAKVMNKLQGDRARSRYHYTTFLTLQLNSLFFHL